MSNAFRLNRRQFAAAMAALGAPAVFAASGFPSKPIRIVVPFTTGGSLDIMSRAIAEQLTRSLGKPVLVENKAGAGGAIGTADVAKAAPDGHTLLMGTIGTHVVNPLTVKSLPYHPVNDFTPINLIQTVPLVLAVHPGLGVNTFQEFIALARSKPDQISIASPSNAHYMGLTRLGQLCDAKFRIVPYRGPAQSIADAVGGHISAVLETGMAIMPSVRAGQLKMLAIGSKQRLATFENTPTFIESGLPNYEISGVNMLYGPAGMPTDVVAKLSEEVRRIVATPAISNLIVNNAGIVVNSTPEELVAWQAKETEIWRRTIVDNNLKFE